ncbi:MAG: ABC transporter permease subunit [Alphaproteobacteria bacterium]|nr:ABC transporter permease subunit [Alphaproteobacteria bacterium]
MAVAGWRVALCAAVFGAWEWYGQAVDATWFSAPSLIAARLVQWAGDGLAGHVAVTLGEMATGLAVGVPLGTALGLFLGRAPVASVILRPIIFALYSVPLVTLAPLFIFWFGLGMLPKIILVAIVTFFLLFFTTFAGVQTIDRDLVSSFRLMGATDGELFRKLIAPACTAWIISGLRLALPYSLIAATVGEMLLAREGLGYLLMYASQQIDMTGMFAALVVLMIAGVAVGELANLAERRLLRWRTSP